MSDEIEILRARIDSLERQLNQLITDRNDDLANSSQVFEDIYEWLGEIGELAWAMAAKMFPGYAEDTLKLMELGRYEKKKPPDQ
jgi:hypothetical protein